MFQDLEKLGGSTMLCIAPGAEDLVTPLTVFDNMYFTFFLFQKMTFYIF